MIRVIVLLLGLGIMGWSNLQAQTIITLDSIQDVSCPINSDGGVFITAVGVPPLSYQWSTGATTADLTGVISGTYRVTITDGNNASVVSSLYTVSAPAVLNVNTDTIINILCGGDSTGAVDITVLGGTAPYTYLWQNGSTVQDITGLPAGPVGLTVTDANGCVASPKSILILEPPVLMSNLDSLQNILCNGTNSGSIDLTSGGGTGTLSFLWNNGATTEDLSGLGVGTYTLTITDSNSCQLVMGPYTISEPTVLGVTIDSVDQIACNGGNTGAIYITASGGVTPYTYFWTQGFGGEDFINTNAGTYQVTVTDANGCVVVSNTQVLSEPAALLIDTAIVQNISCNGVLDGSLDLTLSGGVTPYTFLWNTGATSLDLNALAAGTYTLTITDANGCILVSPSYTIVEPSLLSLSIDSFYNVGCNGLMNGAIFTTSTGGNAPYTYLWSNSASSEDLVGLGVGMYSVTVTDSSGCVATAGPVTIVEPMALAVVLDSINPVNCNGDSSGFITVSVMGGTTPYNYVWDNGATVEDLVNLNGGTYNLFVLDSNGCVANAGPFVVTEPTALGIQLDTIINNTCNGANDGQILITPFGGITPYSYAWSNSATTQDINTLTPGVYNVTMTDGNGCIITSPNYTVTEPSLLVTSLDSLNHVSCNGAADGAIFTSTTGGTMPYSYLWNNGNTTDSITNLNGGVYTATITDANGCVALFGPVTILEPTALMAIVDSIGVVACNGDSTGFIMFSIVGGTAPYSYAWNTGATVQDLTALPAGIYNVTVTDSNGCITNSSLTVTEPTVLSIDTVILQDVTCNGNANGSISLTVIGGTAPYSYSWSNSATTRDLVGLSGGTYTVTITDANGCVLVSPIYTINEPTALNLSIDSLQNITCNGANNGANNGAIYTGLSGGTAPYTYNWSTGDTTSFVDSLPVGSYDIIVTDANACTIAIIGTMISEPAPLTIALDSIRAETCANSGIDGLIDVQALGGTGPYTYTWTDTAQTVVLAVGDSFTMVPAGTYRLTVADANACVATNDYTLGTVSNIQANLDSFTTATCASNMDGAIYISVTDGIGNYTYNWSNGATTQDITNLLGGVYTVTITDSLGCQAVKVYSVVNPNLVRITIDSTNDVTCYNAQNGNVFVTTTGGNSFFHTYSWSNGLTTPNALNISGGTYRLTVTDARDGCQYISDSAIINEPDSIQITLTSVTPETCRGSSQDASITVGVTGGTMPYSYNWASNTSTSNTISNVGASTQLLLVIDGNGCTQFENLTVPALSSPVVSLDSARITSCAGVADGYLRVNTSGGIGMYTYNWSNGDVTNVADSLLGGASYSALYSVTVTDSLGCTGVGTFGVLQPDSIVNTSSVLGVECDSVDSGGIRIFTSGGTLGTGMLAYQYRWSNGDTTTFNDGLSPGWYNLTTTDKNGCIALDSFLIEQSKPIIDPFIGQAGTRDTTVDWGTVVILDVGNDQTSQGVTYDWQHVSALDNPNIDDITAPSTTVTPEPSSSGQYQFLLTATNTNDGCTDTASLYLEIEVQPFLGMPTAFTPNGDGVNDYYRPANIDPRFVKEFRIYNRWGQIIYDGTDLENQWDGTFQGQEQPTEIYMYYIDYQEPGQEGRQIRGEFTLFR
ncbi:MAG: T9SS type B sorting domain-containing protein [Aureispira sp.]